MVSVGAAAFACYGVLLSLCHSFIIPNLPNVNHSMTDISRLGGRDADIDFYLRIMPLGASITKGEPTAPLTEGNGYRKPLRDQLRSEGYMVNMVGTQPLGTMHDNDSEGYPGYHIADIKKASREALIMFRPNLILINAGTNDALKDDDYLHAGDRMESMVWQCFSLVPETTIILSTLIPNGDESASQRFESINEQYRALVPKLQKEGLRITLAEMNDGFINLKDDIWDKDGTHPTLSGFRKMAAVWRHAFRTVESNKWMLPPSDVKFGDDPTDGTICPKVYGSGRADPRQGIKVLTAGSPLIIDDGKYVHKGVPKGQVFPPGAFLGGSLKYHILFDVWLAQLHSYGAPRGQELDDIVYIEPGMDASGLRMRNNKGDGKFDEAVDIDVKDSCKPQGVRWGDVNNDGLDDFICIGPQGDMYVSLNEGGNPPTFKSLGTYKNAIAGYPQANVRLGDIDGDGRLDYCVIAGSGDIRCWRNGGIGEKAEYWQNMGVVFHGKGMGDIDGVRFVDINGDGRDDWLWVGKEGDITTWTNQRGSSKSMRPYWKEAGKTHAGMGTDTEGRNRILMGRIYGTGRADYAYLDWKGGLQVWKNEGYGGTHQKGDGAFWGDMTGNGNDDYLWIDSKGNVVIFKNRNDPGDGSSFGYKTGWVDMGVVLRTGRDRKTIHVGDWDGDGKADIISAARKDGALTVWLTRYENGGFSFEQHELGGSHCNQGWGVGLFDIGARFADITGNGKVDYLCMDPSGRTEACINEEGFPLRCVGQVKFSTGLDRANLHFADVDGDGKADLLWVDKIDGDAKVWYNKGELPEDSRMSGSKFHWDPQKELAYQGASRGPNMHYPNLGGQGRADMVYVEPTTGHGWAWFNACPRGGDDVDGDVPDPGLPAYSPGQVPDPPTDPGRDEFCNGNEGDWTPALWGKLNMDQWLEERSIYYSHAGWPKPPNQEGSVPRVFAEFKLLDHDGLYNWGGQCRSITQTCAVPDLGKRQCADNWERAFALYAFMNLANWLNNVNAAFKSVAESVDKQIAQMTEVFIADQNPELEMSDGAWLTMVVGILGTFTPWIGAVGAAAGASVSGILGIASSMTGKAETLHDPAFTTFAKLEGNFGKFSDQASDAASAYFDRLFSFNPPNGDDVRSTELAHIVQGGLFADQDLGTGNTKVDEDVQRLIAMAPIISEIWNSQRIFIHKFKKESFHFEWEAPLREWKFRYDPCAGVHGPWDGELINRHICLGGYNYMVWSWDSSRDYFFNDYGANDKALDYFGFKLKDVIVSADRVQRSAKEFIPRNSNVQKDIYNNIAQNPLQHPAVEDAVAFNIPVCDTTDLELKWTHEECFGTENELEWRDCLKYVIMHTCVSNKIDGHKWPYGVDDHGFKSG